MEYSITFQDNISAQDFNLRAQGIANWIKENREKYDWAKDPNAYEMANVFLFGAKYASEEESIDMIALDEIWNVRSKDFENCNISENNFVYKICQDAYNAAKNRKALVNDENSHHALRKMAGIGLYLKQQKRDNQSIGYDNLSEYQSLIECSKTLKGIHPELFDRYKFGENIEVLYNLIEKSLSDKEKKQISTSKDELLNGNVIKTENTHRNNQVTDAR